MHSPVDSYPAGRLTIQRAHVLNEFMVTAVKKLKSVTTGAFVSGTWNWQCHPEIETGGAQQRFPDTLLGGPCRCAIASPHARASIHCSALDLDVSNFLENARVGDGKSIRYQQPLNVH